ncbi:sugar phosphate isomerase/epimerase family protein [Phytohabitans sp. ZYX-F-186]|uniref:Sugar phosphate isomerase/epimerase family protein n=1 Tax=Phytohabitans maris TaxID=3071409 RepID=A0ABU0ZVM6_9ACTN|nr:sugar phosphate isomerase/epimerase family protein [Phytohabitans sp. ZYX-F-186]MDQ7910374.1 sugar phosphate isomerase/epimerase family protein [Phytohabitans sp. ZYX-F-186]
MIGLSTYAFFWQHSPRVAEPLTVERMLESTIALGADAFQICDHPEVTGFGEARLDALAARSRAAGVALELGTRGTAVAHLDTYLRIAKRLGARLVRTMVTGPAAFDDLVAVLPRYAAAGVTVALETYERMPSADLVALVERVDHPNLGICLDPANCVAALEHPDRVVDAAAPHVVNLHVKDFAFTRDEGWVGFRLAGAPLGEGALDLDRLFARVRPAERGISQIIEHWLPWQGDEAGTVALERRWTEQNLAYLRRRA